MYVCMFLCILPYYILLQLCTTVLGGEEGWRGGEGEQGSRGAGGEIESDHTHSTLPTYLPTYSVCNFHSQ